MNHVETIGLISDTHDHLPSIERAVELFNDRAVDLVLHAGDVVSPFTARAFGNLEAPFTGVFGNNDGDRVHLQAFFADIGTFHADPYMDDIGGARIAVTHIPELVPSLAATQDVVVYGHTHESMVEDNGALVVNPGECCGYLSGRHTVALLSLPGMQADVIEL
ncbi:MAG: metallophosphoesterase [Thermoplasmatota archaeon]